MVVTALAIAFPVLRKPLSTEGGVLELLSLFCWGGAVLLAIVAILPKRAQTDRLMAGWTGLLALIAFVRELDLHVALNPEVLGSFGVRYRIDWWLDGDVSLWLKLGWTLFFLGLGVALIYPPWALRGEFIRRVRQGDAMVGLFLLAVTLSLFGFVFDDLLRNTKFSPLAVRQTAEESCEVLGAAAFLASALLRCPRELFQNSLGSLMWRPRKATPAP
jgi:hypothetical protein